MNKDGTNPCGINDPMPVVNVDSTGKLQSTPGDKPVALPPGEHIVFIKAVVPAPNSDAPPVASEPLRISDTLVPSKIQAVTVTSPPKPAQPGPPNGFQSGSQSPNQDTLGCPVGARPKSIFDFK